jgi:hypothetical protein
MFQKMMRFGCESFGNILELQEAKKIGIARAVFHGRIHSLPSEQIGTKCQRLQTAHMRVPPPMTSKERTRLLYMKRYHSFGFFDGINEDLKKV